MHVLSFNSFWPNSFLQEYSQVSLLLLARIHEDVNQFTEKPKLFLTDSDEKLFENEKVRDFWTRYLSTDNFSKILDQFIGKLN